MDEEIKAEFENDGFTLDNEEEILKTCVTSCINYKLKPSDLVTSWLVYYLNRGLKGSLVKNDEMNGFLLHLQNEQKEAVLKEESHLHMYSSKDVEMILNDEPEDAKEDVPSTPPHAHQRVTFGSFDSTPQINGNIFSSGKPSRLVTPFGRRSIKFVEKFSLKNMHSVENEKKDDDCGLEDDIVRRAQLPKKCYLRIIGSGPDPGCRFMYDRIEDRFNALENRIKKHANQLVSSGLYGEPVDPTIASQNSIFAVGMICCDGEGHLNDKSILLQSSAEHSGGQRVRLDLQKLSQFSIFPGQVVGIEGDNPSGHCLIASKIVDTLPFSTSSDENEHPAKRQALDQEIQSDEPLHGELSMIIAAGPFTTTDNLLFEPLTELLTYASRKMPQLLVLVGPFVDSEHPEIRRGTSDKSFDEIFRLDVLKKLQDYVEYIGTAPQVILVPSIRDASHDFVFPQPPLDIHPPNIRDQITSLTNPGIFQADQFKIGCCSVDVIRQLSGEELSRVPRDGATCDRMSRIVNHIINQRSFYPLYPPAESVPLDSTLASEALDVSPIPDILIMPSDVKYFVKVLSLSGGTEEEEQVKCICINPGRLAKGEGAGTFVEFSYNGSPDKISASVIAI